MEEITLAKALVELKLLDKRILKRTDQLNPVAVKQNGKLASSTLSPADFEAEATACWQSLRDLMQRRRKIKAALVVANATAKVTVNGDEYTLAEAIENKNMMEREKEIVHKTLRKVAREKHVIEDIKEKNNSKLMKLLESMYGRSGKEHSLSTSDYDAVAVPFKKANDPDFVDPLNCEKMLKDLEDKADTFLAEVDVCLSIANATTTIHV